MDKYHLSIYPTAAEDMEGIFGYISIVLSNPKAAIKQIDDIYNALSRVCDFPNSGSTINNNYVKDRNLRKLIVNNYIFFYRVNVLTTEIKVVRVLYGMMDFKDIL